MIAVDRQRQVAIAGVALVMLLGARFAAIAVSSADGVVNGTVLGGVPVEGLEPAALVNRLAPAAQAVQRRPMTLVVGDREWARSPESLGISVDLEASARAALGSGRGNFAVWILRAAGLGGQHLNWVPKVDGERLEVVIEELAGLVAVEASNGDFRVAGAEVSVDPPANGYVLRRDEAPDALIQAAIRPNAEDRVNLPVDVTRPQITGAQLEDVKLQAETVLSGPADFVFEGRRFSVGPQSLAPSLRVRVVDEAAAPGEGDLVLEADPAILKGAIEEAAPFVNTPARDARFTVAGNKATLQPGVDGSTIDAEAAAGALVELGPAGDREAIELSSVPQPPDLTTEEASKLGIKERVASFTTTFDARNAPRVGNIDKMASAIDGTVLRPGEVFSLNGATGPRTVSNGYQEAGVLVDGEVVPGIGGGVCQVATTLFNAVFSAGMDVEERSNHSLFISSYPTGKDAMVNYGTQDLRFANDTDHGVLLRAWVSARELTVSIYSSPLGRKVTSTTSERSNHRQPEVKYVDDPNLPEGVEQVTAEGKPGFDVRVNRRVVEAGEVIHNDTFVSKYRPWKRIIKRGTGPPLPQEPEAPEAPEAPEPEPLETPAAEGAEPPGGFPSPADS